MKSKIKNPALLDGMDLSTYGRKLKADLSNLKMVGMDQPASFVLHTTFEFEDEIAPLMIIGITTKWKKYIKDQKWLKGADAKDTMLGYCIRKDDEIELQVKKGKLTNTKFRQAIKKNKLLKRFKWELVEDFDEDEDIDSLQTDEGQEQSHSTEKKAEHKQQAEVIGRELITMVKELQKITDKKEKTALMLKIDKRADDLYIIPDWEDYTDDKLEDILAKIDAAVDGQQQENSSESDKIQAEAIVKEMTGIIQKIKDAKGQQKEDLMEELDQLRDELDDIPKWRDYTPDNIERVLEQVQQSLAQSQAKEKATEQKIATKETKYLEKTKTARSEFYKQLENFDASTAKQQVTSLQQMTSEWKAFIKKVLQKPKVADALQHKKELIAYGKEFKQITESLDLITADLEAFNEAIKAKDKVKAEQLKQKIETLLP